MAQKAPISQESADLLLDYITGTVTKANVSWWRDKLERVDLAYYCMPELEMADNPVIKEKVRRVGLDPDQLLEAPVIISQIETAKAIVADTFLSGYPTFGVVAAPDKQAEMEQVETLIAYYEKEGKWRNSLLRFIHTLCAHGLAPYALVTKTGYDFSGELNLGTNGSMKKRTPWILPELLHPDPYNIVFDYRVPPVDLPEEGEYVGYAKMPPATTMKALLLSVQDAHGTGADSPLMNLSEWMQTSTPYSSFYLRPTIQALKSDGRDAMNRWDIWYDPRRNNTVVGSDPARYYHNSTVLFRRLWLRLIPSEFKLPGLRNTPTVFEVWVINDSTIVYFQPVYMERNCFPMGIADVHNEGNSYAAKSEPELFYPIQHASSVMLNSVVAGAMRAVDDRALFDPNFVRASDLASKSGSAYVPLVKSLAQDRSLDSVYRSIPFDASASFTLPNLIRELVSTAQMLRGRNNFAQGLPQRGNRTLGEFAEVMQNADSRQQLQALQLESAAFADIKRWIKEFIASNAQSTTMLNQRTKRSVEISPEVIASLSYDFSLATGYFSRRMVANTDMLQEYLRLVLSDEQIRQRVDALKLANYIMALEGVKDLDQFVLQAGPIPPAQPPMPMQEAGAEQVAMPPVMPMPGMPQV